MPWLTPEQYEQAVGIVQMGDTHAFNARPIHISDSSPHFGGVQ